MRTRLALFLLSGVLVYGCVQQEENASAPPEYPAVSTQLKSDLLPSDEPCTDANPCVRVHEVILDGYCPDDKIIRSRDVVKFRNRTDGIVRITDLDTRGKKTATGDSTTIRMSGLNQLLLHPPDSTKRNRGLDSLAYVQVNKNPFKGQYLTFHYGVTYQGRDCVDAPDGPRGLWSVPPTMIVGPDTL